MYTNEADRPLFGEERPKVNKKQLENGKCIIFTTGLLLIEEFRAPFMILIGNSFRITQPDTHLPACFTQNLILMTSLPDY